MPENRKNQPTQPPASTPGAGLNRQPFDMAKMNYEAARKAKRRKLLRWSLPLVILAFILALWLILPYPLTYQAIKQYNHKKYPSARNWLVPVTWSSPQPFVAAFDSGTVDSQLGNYPRAETELTRALQLAPPDKRCMVVQNLVYTLEAHADELTEQSKTQDAKSLSSQAVTYRNDNKKCFQSIAPSKEQNDGGGGGGGAAAESNQILSSTQQDSLDQKNAQGQQSQVQDFLDSAADTDSPAIHPW